MTCRVVLGKPVKKLGSLHAKDKRRGCHVEGVCTRTAVARSDSTSHEALRDCTLDDAGALVLGDPPAKLLLEVGDAHVVHG